MDVKMVYLLMIVILIVVDHSSVFHLSRSLPGTKKNTKSVIKEVDDRFVYVLRIDISGSWLDVHVKRQLCDPPYRLNYPRSRQYDNFGYSVSSNNVFLVIGAPLSEHSNSTDQGAVYVFELSLIHI